MTVGYHVATTATETLSGLKAVIRNDGVTGSSTVCDITQSDEIALEALR
jgi:hypothetical protein